ncbi:MAG: ubiquinol-cytochrome c reductase iron-sulfur subunit [Candidatus Dormibacteria bacterium]
MADGKGIREPGGTVRRTMDGSSMTRRRFAVWGTAVSGGVVSLALGIPIVGFLLSPLFRRTDRAAERLVGYVGDIPEGQPVKYEVLFPQNAWPVPEEAHAVYVVRQGSTFRVFSNICTHMQCPVRFQKDINQFLCPCHGGLYDLNGLNVGGPPPKPLPQYASRIDARGNLFVSDRLSEHI